MFVAVMINTTTLSNGYTTPEFLHKPIITDTSWCTAVVVLAIWRAV